MAEISDLGYDESSISWTWKSPQHQPRTTVFEKELALMGPHFLELLNAAKRLRSHGRPSSIQHAIGAIRRTSEAVAAHPDPKPSAPENWANALEVLLRASASSEHAKWATFNHASGIFREVARKRGYSLRLRNRFSRKRAITDIAIVQKDALGVIVSQARADALRYFNEFVSPDQEIADLLKDGAALARENRGVLPSSDEATGEIGRFVRRCRKRGVSLRKVERLMYATEKSIIPFLLLITYALAGNVDSVSLMRLDCMTSFVNPLLGRRRSLKLDKPRSGEIPPYSVAERGTLSTPWLIDAVRKMNESVRPYARPEDSNFLFLCVTGQGNIRVLHSSLRWDAFRRYIRDKCPSVPTTTAMRMFRPTRAINDYERHRDPWRTKDLLHHSSLSTTIPYLDNIVSREVDEVLVADSQATMLTSIARSKPTGDEALPASLPSHTCKEPESPIHGHDQNGLCVNFLWPLNSRYFVLSLEPRPVAFLLREYQALCEARLRLPTARFEKVWGPELRLITDRYLPQIDAKLRQAAELLIPELPPMRHIT